MDAVLTRAFCALKNVGIEECALKNENYALKNAVCNLGAWPNHITDTR
jgi:hypothetical protein